MSRAENLRLFDLNAVREVLDRAGRRRGAALLRSVLESYAGPTLTDEELEEWFLGLCRAARLPAPEVNSWLVLSEESPTGRTSCGARKG